MPGLIGAVRAGRVVMANALGSGVLESAAWLGFLPRVAERLLGESLTLPAVATWWCGEQPALDYVVANLDRLVVKPAYPNQHFEPVFGRDFDEPSRALHPAAAGPSLRVRGSGACRTVAGACMALERHAELCGQGIHHPCLRDCDSSGRRVLPGGLARVAAPTAVDVVSTQSLVYQGNEACPERRHRARAADGRQRWVVGRVGEREAVADRTW